MKAMTWSAASAGFETQALAIAAIGDSGSRQLDEHLAALGKNEKHSVAIRAAALSVVARHGGTLRDDAVRLLAKQCEAADDPLARRDAADALGGQHPSEILLHHLGTIEEILHSAGEDGVALLHGINLIGDRRQCFDQSQVTRLVAGEYSNIHASMSARIVA
ncbi:MAG: hypothetical protein IID41_17075 [Planctomycetes bacterium]|nr:hypothetical protein [Planctomycetota bacterium]